ncbi:MAG: mannitol dehydrogenase family protein [Pseudomonadota bacterium]
MDELTPSTAKQAIALNDENLSTLPAEVGRPNYDRSSLSPGIIHVGVGNFHRAHQSWYMHQLFQKGLAHDWAILGAGVRPYDTDMRQKLLRQDCLTTLIELDPRIMTAEVVGSMIDYLPISPDNGPLIKAIADPAIRTVTMTVTEGGYFINPATQGFDETHSDVQHDAANPKTPKTGFGAIITGLKNRKDSGLGPITLQSCDNLQGNGGILRQTIVSLADMSDPKLAKWISANCSFPNSMVDSIVPATGPDERALAREFGVDDTVPVTHENFRQWVIEDEFCAGRPPLEDVGATYASNVHGYEAMKLRILNAGHQILANAGELLSLSTVAECMQHQLVGAFFQKVQTDEVLPHVPSVTGTSAEDYLSLVIKRFSNTAVKDTVRRVAFDGSSRHPGFLLPTIRDGLDRGVPIDGLALAEALWARMCLGRREDGTKIEPNDPNWPSLVAAAQHAIDEPAAWLRQKSIYGDLGDAPRFAEAFGRWCRRLDESGTSGAIADYLDAA